MDSDGKGLGDKNMDMLFGLDMLKRHRCNIDLGANELVFNSGSGVVRAPFMHEYELPEEKGGTKGFDAEKANQEIEEYEAKRDRERAESGGSDVKEDGEKEDSKMEG